MNKPNLRIEQPHLWRNVVALAISLIVIGLPFIFGAVKSAIIVNLLQYLMPIHSMGYTFTLIGLLLYASTYFPRKNYAFCRTMLAIALGYAIAWLIAIIIGAFSNTAGFTTMSLWGYYTFTIYTISKDPGFAISALIRDVRSSTND
jgi:hypothetical protein